MSSTSTTTLERPYTASTSNSVPISCHKCGANLSHSHQEFAQDAQQRIGELEAQVKILTLRATAAVERVADYEDELHKIKSATSSHYSPRTLPNTLTHATDASPAFENDHLPPRPSTAHPSTTTARTPRSSIPLQDRLSYLLPSRRSTSQPPSSAPAHKTLHPPHTAVPYPQTAGLIASNSTATETDLLTALTHEQTLRLAAENQVNQTNDELEELTGQLFQQANEMVASERKARARLEERVVVLERRDGEKRKRLEVLEGRLGRIERVRGLLQRSVEGGGSPRVGPVVGEQAAL